MPPKSKNGTTTACLACRSSKSKCVYSDDPSNGQPSASDSDNTTTQSQEREENDDDDDDEYDRENQEDMGSSNKRCERCVRLDKKCEVIEHKRGRKKGKVQQQQISRRIENISKLVGELIELIEPEKEIKTKAGEDQNEHSSPSSFSPLSLLKKSKSTIVNGWNGADKDTCTLVNDLFELLNKSQYVTDIVNGSTVKKGNQNSTSLGKSSSREQSKSLQSRSESSAQDDEDQDPNRSVTFNNASLYSSSVAAASSNSGNLRLNENHPRYNPHQKRIEKEDERSLSAVSISIRPNNPLRFLGSEANQVGEEFEENSSMEMSSRKRTRNQAENERIGNEEEKGKENDRSINAVTSSTSATSAASISNSMSFSNLMNSRNKSDPNSSKTATSSSIISSVNPSPESHSTSTPQAQNATSSNLPSASATSSSSEMTDNNSWTNYFSKGVFHPSYDSSLSSLDPIRSNILSLSRSIKLFESFFHFLGNKKLDKSNKKNSRLNNNLEKVSKPVFGNGISNFIHIFDPNLSTFDYVRKHSSFLLCVILLLSSEFDLEKDLDTERREMNKGGREEDEEEDISFASDSLSSFGIGYYEKKLEIEEEKNRLKSHIENHSSMVLNGNFKSVELAQACFLLANYQPISSSATDDRTWTFLGNAIRIATEIGCNLSCYSYQATSDSEHHLRQLRNVERLWISIWTFSFTLSSQTGQRYNLSEDSVISSCSSWHQRPYSLPQDECLVAFVELRRIINRHSDGFHRNVLKNSSSSFISGGNHSSRKEKEKEKGKGKDKADSLGFGFGEDEHLELQLDFFRDCVTADLKRWSETWLRDDENDDEVPSPLKFTGALYLHNSTLLTLSLPLRSGLDTSSSTSTSSNLSSSELAPLYRETYGAALNYLTAFVENFSNNTFGKNWIKKIPNSLVISTVYCSVFALRLSSISNSWEKSNGNVGISKERIENLCRKVAELLEISGNERVGIDNSFVNSVGKKRSLGCAGGFSKYLLAILDRRSNNRKNSNFRFESNKRQKIDTVNENGSKTGTTVGGLSNDANNQSQKRIDSQIGTNNFNNFSYPRNQLNSANTSSSDQNDNYNNSIFDLPTPFPFGGSETHNGNNDKDTPRTSLSNHHLSTMNSTSTSDSLPTLTNENHPENRNQNNHRQSVSKDGSSQDQNQSGPSSSSSNINNRNSTFHHQLNPQQSASPNQNFRIPTSDSNRHGNGASGSSIPAPNDNIGMDSELWNWLEFGNLAGGLPILDQMGTLLNETNRNTPPVADEEMEMDGH